MLKGHQGPHKPCPNAALRERMRQAHYTPSAGLKVPADLWAAIQAALHCTRAEPCELCRKRALGRAQKRRSHSASQEAA